jgi:DNA-binding response OmpR family regulator
MMEPSKPKLLIVDDEAQIRLLLKEFLSEEFDTETATNGVEAVSLARSWHPSVILMDIMMPQMDGIHAVEVLRDEETTRHIPILMLTAMNTSLDRIKAFNLGADDFISKPFEVEELMSRLKSKIRRAKELRNIPPEVVTLGNLNMDVRSREVKIADQLIDLSPAEYGILQLLLARQGEVVSRKEIMNEVWEDGKKSDRLIDAHVTSLRKKIASFSGEIQTVYGEGYRIKSISA